MTIKELLNTCPYEKIQEKIAIHYGMDELDKYELLYINLKNTEFIFSSKNNLFIYINAYRQTEDDFYIVNNKELQVYSFNEDDTSLNFDVSGYEEFTDTVYSISSSSFNDFLQYKIDEKTLKSFSPETILAHCFYEITSYGFEKIE